MIVVWAINTVMFIRFDGATFLTFNKLFLVKDIPPGGIPIPDYSKEWDNLFRDGNNETMHGRMISFLLDPLN